MLEQKNIGIAVRLYENQKYGTTYAKGQYRRAIYNGSIDIKNPKIKYLIDLCPSEEWLHSARTDAQMEIIRGLGDISKKYLCSWLFSYNSDTKQKTFVAGLCRMDIDTMLIEILICDDVTGVELTETLQVKACRTGTGNVKSPQLLATNEDLAAW